VVVALLARAGRGMKARVELLVAGHQREGGAALWLGFAVIAGGFASLAGHVAVALSGWPRWIALAGFVVTFPLALGFMYLAYASHYERWPFKPPPMAEPWAGFL
jgi:hypothetical protein